MRRAIVGLGALLCFTGCGSDQASPGASSATAVAGAAAIPGATSPSVTPASNVAAAPTSAAPAAANPAAPSAPGAVPVVPAAPQTAAPPPVVPGTTAAVPPAQMQPAQPAGPPALPPGAVIPDGFKPNAMNECNLHTKWKGDEFCILPPPPDKGFQLHIGPSNYDNPEAQYILQPGQENVRNYVNTAANDKNIQFYVRQYRMRPGAHHTIVRDTSTGRRLSGADINQDHPTGGIIAPENADIGIPLSAHAPISTDHHAINTTDQPLLQEVWVNFWYVDASKVKEVANVLYDPGNVTQTIAPHQDVVLGPYACDVQGKGRLIDMFGHVHANNVRFSAWRTRGGKKELIYEAFHWEEPLWLEFSSLAKNHPSDATKMTDGGWTGILDLEAGDTLSWECHEVNQQNTALRFTNQTFEGWMCIIIGEIVGTKCMSRTGIVLDPSVE